MNKLDIIRKSKSLFMKWGLHRVARPFGSSLQNLVSMSDLSAWRNQHPVKGYNDWYQTKWDYSRRYNLYEAVGNQHGVFNDAIDYMEFGVSGGASFRWWLEHNANADSRFYGFDTFEGLPESFGPFGRGSMAASLESLQITDSRASFYKGLFQQTLIPFLEQYENKNRKVIHMDADLFSATIFSLSQLYRFFKRGDIIFFDEFAVPKHEFLAFKIFTESFYVDYDVIGAANNYLFVAIQIKGEPQ